MQSFQSNNKRENRLKSSVQKNLGFSIGGVSSFKKKIENGFLIGVPLIGSIIAVIHIYRYGLTLIDIISFLFHFLLVGLGVSLGLHRLFSHASFKPHPVIGYSLGALGSMAFQGSILRWVADHRRHHAHTDETGDVHSPTVDPWGSHLSGLRGFFHSHIGWMFDSTVTDLTVYGKRLLDDPVIQFFTRTHWLWPFISLLLPYLFGYALGGTDAAWSSMLIGGCLRTTVLHHVVWSVNSIGHTFGNVHFELDNTSKNNFVLAILTLGDGWHNNHHRFPRSYRQGLYKGQVDFNARLIELMARFGLASNLIDNSGVKRDV
jgi:stearoyl-CoA desaturase (Delta-9 desaturase)